MGAFRQAEHWYTANEPEHLNIDVVRRILDLTGRDVEVVLGGGLFHGETPTFLERIRSGIVGIAPAARLTQVTAPPVVGAALLGLDRLGAAPGAAERLRATLTHERLGALRPVMASNR